MGYNSTSPYWTPTSMSQNDLCNKCHGLNKKRCFMCGKTWKQWIKTDRQAVIMNAHLYDTWIRLKTFKGHSSGNPQTDIRLVLMFGHWLGKQYVSPNFSFIQ